MSRFATLSFERQVAAPVETLWQVWTAPAARIIWAAPTPAVTLRFLEAQTGPGGQEVSICTEPGAPDIRCEARWLDCTQPQRSVNSEMVFSEGLAQSAALVTAEIEASGTGSRLCVTVQLASLACDMEADTRQGFEAALDTLVGVAERTMLLTRTIAAPRALVWRAWLSPDTLPLWWGPEGFSCRTDRINLRTGGEWVFDMIAPDGTVFPNHHLYTEVRPEERIAYTLLWGENGPKHADAWASFDDLDDQTLVRLGMIFSTAAEFQDAKGFGAEELGQQTLGKLARFVGVA